MTAASTAAVTSVVSDAEAAATAAATAAVSEAYSYIEAVHLAPCRRAAVTLMCPGTRGIANDLNAVVRALWLSVLERRQLVVTGDWHWLNGETPMSDVVIPSRCQRRLSEASPADQEQLSCRNGTRGFHAVRAQPPHDCLAATRARFLFSGDVRCATHGTRGDALSERDVPAQFRRHGVLWWMQVLSTYLLRIRGHAAARLQRRAGHKVVAMPALVPRGQAEPLRAAAGPSCRVLDHDAALRRATVDGAGWRPSTEVQLALHIRWGDACGGKRPDYRRRCYELIEQTPGRKKARSRGLPSLVPVSARLAQRGLWAASTHLATDSEHIANQALRGVANETLGQVSFLNVSRTKYEPPRPNLNVSLNYDYASHLWLENFAGSQPSVRDAIFDETMLDLLLLARAPVVAGQMLGNMPRLALQLRVSWPPSNDSLAQYPQACSYVSLDGRGWCPATICRYARATSSNGTVLRM